MLQDCESIQTCQMKPVSKNEAPRRPQQSTQHPRTEIPSVSVYGFPVSVNQFELLEESQPAVSTSSSQIPNRLVDPRTTRLARQRAARGITGQGTSSNEGIFDTVPLVRDAQGKLTNGDCVETLASTNEPKFFPHFLSISAPNVLEL